MSTADVPIQRSRVGPLDRMRSWVGIREGQGARALRLLGLVFLCSGALAALKAAQSGIFLEACARSAIPWAFAASALTLAAASAISVSLIARLGPVRLALLTLLGVSAASLLLFPLLLLGVPRAPFIAYVVIEASAGLLIIQVWGVVSDAVDPRSAKALYPMAGLGGSLAWVLSGLVVPPVVALVGAESLLLLAPLVLLACAGLVGSIVHLDLAASVSTGRRGTGLREGLLTGLDVVRGSSLMRVAAGLTVGALLLDQLVDYQLLAVVQDSIASAEGIAAFMSAYFALTSLVSVVVLAVFSGRIFAWLGASRSLMLVPLVLVVLTGPMLLLPGLLTAVLMRGGYRVLKQSLWSSGMQQALLPLPSVARGQARALTRGVVAPLAYAVTACGLGLLPPELSLRWLAGGTVVLCLMLVSLVGLRLGRAYRRSLLRAIDERSLVLDELSRTLAAQLDADAAEALCSELRDPDHERAALAAELLSGGEGPVAAAALMVGLEHMDADVRALSVDGLARLGAVAAADDLVELLTEDPDVEVRRACANALRLLRPEPEWMEDALKNALSDADAEVRAVASVALLQGRSSEERRAGLLPMLESAEPEKRRAAASAVTTRVLVLDKMQDALALVLEDEEVRNRIVAVRKVARYQLVDLLPRVIAMLDDPATAPVVAETLPQWEAVGLDALSDWLATAPAHSARHVARSLARVPGADATLLRLLGHRSPLVREQSLRALVQVVQLGERDPMPVEIVQPLLDAETALAWRYCGLLAGLCRDGERDCRDGGPLSFLAGELELVVVSARHRVLALLVVAGHRGLQAALEASDRNRTGALDPRVAELIEVTLSRAVSAPLVPLFEPLSLRELVEVGRGLQVIHEDLLGDPLGTIVDHESPHLRRSAMLCYGETFTARYPDQAREDAPMMPLFERMRFLRSVPLFAALSGADLRSVARILEPLDCEPGRVVLHKGDEGDELFVIVRGAVSIRDGGTTLAELSEREFFGELSVLDRSPRSADAVCESEARLLRLRGADLDELMAKRPEIQREIMMVLVRRLREATAKLGA